MANFEKLDFEQGIPGIITSITSLEVLNPMKNKVLIEKVENLNENNMEEVMERIADLVVKSNDRRKYV